MSALVRPPRRQGPGPIRGAPSGAGPAARAARVRRPAGERRAAGLGRGTELAQIRPYQVGDDVRLLDAAASARTGGPHVREHVPGARAHDVDPARRVGVDGVRQGARLKSDVAAGVGGGVGRLACGAPGGSGC